MRNAKRTGLMIILVIAFIPKITVNATDKQTVETSGTIGFNGIYEPIGTPEPKPPGSVGKQPLIESAKPDGKLPKTNEIDQSWLIGLGACLIGYVFIQSKKNQTIKESRNFTK